MGPGHPESPQRLGAIADHLIATGLDHLLEHHEAVNAVFEAIVTSVAKGNRVTVVGFGTFLPRTRKARSGRSPVNGKEIKICAKTIPAFAAGQGFREAVDKN